MRKYIFAYLSLLVAASVSVPLCHADSGGQWYGFATVGHASTDIQLTVIEKIDDDETAFGIGFGFRASENFAIEGSYVDFGSPRGIAECPPELFCVTQFSSEPVDVDGWSVALRGNAPVNDNVSVFARLGLLAWDASATSPHLSDSDTDILYGVGITSRLTDRVGLQLEFDKAEADISVLKLGITLGF